MHRTDKGNYRRDTESRQGESDRSYPQFWMAYPQNGGQVEYRGSRARVIGGSMEVFNPHLKNPDPTKKYHNWVLEETKYGPYPCFIGGDLCNIDHWILDYEHHNGPGCKNCYKDFCMHCNPEIWEEECLATNLI